jgi:dipeptidase E
MRLVLIGGGSLRNGKHETQTIDRQILEMTGKDRPKVLFVPTVSRDAQTYINNIKNAYGDTLGAQVDVLELHGQTDNLSDMIREKVNSADIIYFGGGSNLQDAINTWKLTGAEAIFRESIKTDKLFVGLSAGAYALVEKGISSRKHKAHSLGLNVVSIKVIGHYDRREEENLRLNLSKIDGRVVAIDERAALFIQGNTLSRTRYQVLRCSEDVNAYLLNSNSKQSLGTGLLTELL